MMSCALHLKGTEAGEICGSLWAVHAVCVSLCVNHAARLFFGCTSKSFMHICTVNYCKTKRLEHGYPPKFAAILNHSHKRRF